MCPHNSQRFLFVPDVVHSVDRADRSEARARNQLALRIIIQLRKLGRSVLVILLARLATSW